MDDSKPRNSDAAGSRKRRSSILKSQRSVRAPLSELEFNVATPPDQSKSRRVSFSRRTGVAEFEITEATTAWKNVYEEHNKSLESSANESGVKAAPCRVSHLGARASYFTDEEAEGVEASDPSPCGAGPELSELATHTHNTIQLFRLDTNPALRELTDDLNVDFSAVTPLDDDLESLRRDSVRDPRPDDMSVCSIEVDFNATHFTLKVDDDMSITDTIRSPTVAPAETRSHVDWTADKENIVFNPYAAPKASDNFALSDDCEDILVFDGKKCKFQSNLDLGDDEGKLSRTVVYDDVAADMSVTEAVARVVLPARDEVDVTQPGRGGQRTVLLDNDMSVTRVVPAQILPGDLSDDRNLRTVVYDDVAADMSVTEAVARVVLPARDEVDVTQPGRGGQRTVLLDNDMSVTRVVPAQILPGDLSDDRNLRTIVYDDAAADMSVTQAVARVVLPARDDVVPLSCVDQKSVLLDDDMAMTRVIPAQILQWEDGGGALGNDGKRATQTIVYDAAAADMSVTLGASRIVLPGRDEVIACSRIGQKTALLDNDMTVTQSLPAQILSSEDRREDGRVSEPNATRRRTVVFDGDEGDISVTQTVPCNIINAESSEVRQPEHYNQGTLYGDMADMSITQVMPAGFIEEPQRRKTIVFDDDDGHVSMTEVVPVSALLAPGRRDSVTPALAPENAERRRTNVFNNKEADISITGVVSTNIHEEPKVTESENIRCTETIDRVATRKCSPDEGSEMSLYVDGNMSKTQAGPFNIDAESAVIIQPEPDKQETIYFEDIAEMSVTQAVPAHLVREPQRRKTIVFENDDGNISMTEVVPAGALLAASPRPADSGMPQLGNTLEKTNRRRTIVYNNEDANISITAVVTANIQVAKLTEPITRSPEREGSEISSFVDSMRPHVSPGSSPTKSRSSFYAMSTSPTRNSLGGGPDSSQRDSILDVLLDMSQASVEALAIEYVPQAGAQATASDTTVTDPVPPTDTTTTNSAPTPGRDGKAVKKDDEIKENASVHLDMEGVPEHPALEGSQPLPIEYKKEKHGIVCKLQHKLSELKDLLHFKEKTSPRKGRPKPITYSRYTEDDKNASVNVAPPDSCVDLEENRSQMDYSDARSASPERNKTAGQEKNKTLMINWSPPKEVKNDSLTFSRQDCEEDCQEPEKKEQSQWTGQADDTRAILDALSDFTDTRRSGEFEHKPSCSDQSRRSSAPDRKSLVITREDFLRDLSMAKAIMKTEMQQTEELAEGSSDEQEATPPRLRNEVVKTLRFEDDDSIIEPRVLHKPAVVDSPPRRASTVIPTYDVSDHVKELVHDLIKPMADVVPQCLSDFSRAEPSRGSQVDTLESSQIDLIPSTPVLIEPRRTSCLRRSPESVAQHTEMQVDPRGPSPRKVSPEPAVIVFDHLNPLNNIFLPPADQAVVHKYDPRRSEQSFTPSIDSQAVQTDSHTPHSRSVDCGMVLVTSTVDRAVSSEPNVRDTEVNTSIVMKGNRELLAASSSLTLVDDALARSAFDVSVEREPELRARSPVRVIFKLDEPYSSVKLDSDLTSCDSSSDHKPLKREHIPSKGHDVTPKPVVKVQRVCHRSRVVRRLRSMSPSPAAQAPSPPSSPPPSSRSSSLTVAALWACARSTASSGTERADWRPELMHEPSSKNLASEEDPGVNVVARIDVLPFMGTSDCEWESRAGDTWSFRLLRGRLRMLVRLEHRACNITRAAVRADTPVRAVHVQHSRPDNDSDPVAALCLCLASEALQRVAARGVARAGAVPALLRRGAAVARVALRWGRAMRAARSVLAFTLADDGLLSLKVANIPLRSVWEVSLRVELRDAGRGRGVPWPRATCPRAARVVAAWAPEPAQLERMLDALPDDWGHVPRAVWKIFKYLKNKRPEDDLLAA